MQIRYTKSEITNRVHWVNFFRVIFGSIFFAGLVLMNAFHVSLPAPTVVLTLIGLFILFYAMLTYYYLKTQKPSLNEIVFLSVFLGIVDILFITAFVYFSGGYDSPYFAFYLLVLATVPVVTPYFIQSVFLWAAVATALYELIITATMSNQIPYYMRGVGISYMTEHQERISVISAFAIPTIIVLFSLGVYALGRVLESERQKLWQEMAEAKGLDKKIVALSSAYWTFTHVFKPEIMLNQALDKILEALGLSLGMVMLLDRQNNLACRVCRNVPREVIDSFHGKSLKQAAETPPNLKGIVIGGEVIRNIVVRSLVFHNRSIGLLVLFEKEGEERIDARLKEPLDAVADEMASAIYYGKLLRRLK